MTRKWVLLDRDGTIIVDKKYLRDPEGVELLPGAAVGLRRLSDAGFILTVVTNQSGVGRGYFSCDDVNRVHDRLREILAQHGVFLHGIYSCFHAPWDNCVCRKPKTGLIELAKADLHLMNSDICCVIGDKQSDMGLARNLCTKGVLVGSEEMKNTQADCHCNDLWEAAGWLLSRK